MFLQQPQQAQGQWVLNHQQNQQAAQMHGQVLLQESTLGQQSSRKRGLGNDAEEFPEFKKRNLGSQTPPQQSSFHFAQAPDSPGSIASNLSTDHGALMGSGYFDQPHLSGASSPGTGSFTSQYLSSSFGGMSAPPTPSGTHLAPSYGWNSFAQQQSQPGSHSSPPTPHVTAVPTGSSGAATANVYPTPSELKSSLQDRLRHEQQTLHEAQQQEQQRLLLAQQQELLEMQRNIHQHSMSTAVNHRSPIHHDHNDPATWADSQASTGQLTGYLGGSGRGYTPAVINGVAALAAMAAASRNAHAAGRGGMDMDF